MGRLVCTCVQARTNPFTPHAQPEQRSSGSSTVQVRDRQADWVRPLALYCSILCVGRATGMRLSAGVANELRVNSAKAAASRIRAGDKSDRATVEQALDPRTRMVSRPRGLLLVYAAAIDGRNQLRSSRCSVRGPRRGVVWVKDRSTNALACNSSSSCSCSSDGVTAVSR
jgi:hypothetical protein